MSSTLVTIGPICARRARRSLIHLKLSALFPIDPCPTSVGVQSLTSTAGRGARTTARLSHRKTPSSSTSHRFVRPGELADEQVDEARSVVSRGDGHDYLSRPRHSIELPKNGLPAFTRNGPVALGSERL